MGAMKQVFTHWQEMSAIDEELEQILYEEYLYYSHREEIEHYEEQLKQTQAA